MPKIAKLLVAGRGEIARRIMRTARQMGIATVAVYADPDADSPFARDADEAVALRGTTGAETYLDAAKILEAARRTGADAVHPGYGFLAESAEFARAVIGAALLWVGPNPDAIAAMGDKVAAKRLMQKAGVPTLPTLEVDGAVTEGVLKQARAIAYPLLVKAAGGGGGKGMRVVAGEEELAAAVAGARREAAGAFANDAVFLERYIPGSRHVEIQVLGDRHGHVVHCFERECSIQRRYQKIIEEAPSPAVDEALRRRLGEAAVAGARAIGYDSAGTVEFLLDSEQNFYFLEMNTRLQVEHPVTEEITGLDLVREQIRIAEGEQLSLRGDELRISGHAIEARLYAEDPANGFLPSSGRLVAWEPDPALPARIESGVESGAEVSPYFDPMLAKLIVHAPTRAEAALRLARVLERLRVHGVTTNRDFLVNVLRHPAFLSGDTTTDFIEKHDPARGREIADEELQTAALAAALASQEERRRGSRVLATIPSGWRNNPSAMQEVRFLHRGEEIITRYLRRRDGSFDYDAGGRCGRARVLRREDDRLEIEIDGVQRTLSVASGGARRWVQGASGEVSLLELDRFPEPQREHVAGGYAAPMPGRIVAVNVKPGQRVAAGQGLVILEAMKMEHIVSCAADGTVAEVRVAVGQQVQAGEILLVVDEGGEA